MDLFTYGGNGSNTLKSYTNHPLIYWKTQNDVFYDVEDGVDYNRMVTWELRMEEFWQCFDAKAGALLLMKYAH